jgi:hypothetical protein
MAKSGIRFSPLSLEEYVEAKYADASDDGEEAAS